MITIIKSCVLKDCICIVAHSLHITLTQWGWHTQKVVSYRRFGIPYRSLRQWWSCPADMVSPLTAYSIPNDLRNQMQSHYCYNSCEIRVMLPEPCKCSTWHLMVWYAWQDNLAVRRTLDLARIFNVYPAATGPRKSLWPRTARLP